MRADGQRTDQRPDAARGDPRLHRRHGRRAEHAGGGAQQLPGRGRLRRRPRRAGLRRHHHRRVRHHAAARPDGAVGRVGPPGPGRVTGSRRRRVRPPGHQDHQPAARLALRVGQRAPDVAAPLRRGHAGRLRLRAEAAGGAGRRRAASLLAGDAARPRRSDAAPDDLRHRRLHGHFRGHAPQPGADRGPERGARGVAAERVGQDDHPHGGAPAAPAPDPAPAQHRPAE